ncbi:helix-turn-helix domain-containing protein [Chryseobacterium sp. SIMBA_038]|uniref:helix-turn-helix domain-containing protein n=1 Tax=Chryseobacterium sp. SIMBA_038 TaxID=3085780 RepID=UPI00397E87CD
MENAPDYKRIYKDVLNKKFPHKIVECQKLLDKKMLSTLDIIKLNTMIFGENKETLEANQKHRSYTDDAIMEILEYQKKNRLNNSQIALHFRISRNSVAKWKKRNKLNF